MEDTSRRLALITGGTKGLGFSVAKVLLAADFDVLLTYGSDDSRAKETQDRLTGEFPCARINILRADVTDLASVEVIAESLSPLGTKLDAVVLNAGLTARGSLEDLQLQDWNRVVTANLTFPTFLLQRLLPVIAEGGSVVFTGSLMGIEPHSMSLPYGVTKSATHALARNLVKFLAPRNIRVNAVAPGFVDTEWQFTKPEHIRASVNSKIALGRFAKPDEVARIYLDLIDSPYLNGEIIRIDGGYSYR